MQLVLNGLLILACLAPGVELNEREIRKSIDDAEALLGMDREPEGVKQLETMVATLNDRIGQEPRNAVLQELLGLANYDLRKFDDAIKACDAAIALDSRNAKTHHLKGMSLWQTDKLKLAIKELDQAKSLDTKSAKYWADLGEALLENEDTAKAESALQESMRLDSKQARVWFALSIIDSQSGRIEAAVEKSRKAIALDPTCMNAIYNAGQGCQTLGRHQESLDHFLAASKLEPDDERVAAKIVQCQQALKRPKERDEARERILKLFRDKKTQQEFYVRDQFRIGDLEVMALEYFELKGDRPVRYSFAVRRKGAEESEYRISMGSYDSTNAIGQKLDPLSGGRRYFHIDRYWPNGGHETFRFFKGEPTYDEVRSKVEDIVSGKAEPESSTFPAAPEKK